MNVLHGWAIAMGAAVVAVPIIIHFLTRPRPVRMPLSTLRFLREVVEQKRAKNRLRDWIILLLRTAAVMLVALAFARPMFAKRAAVTPADKGAKVARVVIVDQSMSMSAGRSGVTAFERARAIASAHLTYDPNVRVNLILAGAQPRPAFDRLTSNYDAVREALSKANPRSERLNIQPTINA